MAGSRTLLPWGIAAGALLVAFGLPWLQVRPNRVVEGTARYLWDEGGWAWAAAILWLIPMAFVRSERALFRAVWLACCCSPALLVAASGAVASTLSPADSFVRVSPSWAFWASLAWCYAGALVLSPRTGWSRWGSVPLLIAVPIGFFLGWFSGLSIMKEYEAQSSVFWAEVGRHLALSGTAVAVGTVLGVVIGWVSSRMARFRQTAFFLLNLVQTLPSLAFFGLLIVPLSLLGWGGIGPTPALIALSLYAAFPIARSTLTALDNLDRAVLDAGTGLGMSGLQLLVRVQAPLALRPILSGIRTASVQAVGNTVIAALIGAGGLGSLIFFGLGQYAPDLILLGTLPVVALALGLDAAWASLLKLVPGRRM